MKKEGDVMGQFPNRQPESIPTQIPVAPMNQPANGMAIAAMVLGITALVFAFIPFMMLFGWIGAVVGIILAAVAKARGNKGGAATAGLVCSIISLAIGALILVACAACMAPFMLL